MYTEFFNLREMPFSITPDPAYLYMSPRHQEALGHLLYGTGQYGGFVQLTGEVGTGKTTVVRTLLEQKLDDVDVAMIHNPRQSEQEFVQSICDELGVGYDRQQISLKTLVDALNDHLLKTHAAGRRTVLIIDEAQNLDVGVLEQVRLLTNLETHKQKLLRIMLIGQPELSETLSRPDLRQLAQRITARYHLTPLDEHETSEYIRHRLRVAGSSEEIFTPAAVREIQRHSRGVPRLINILCDRAMLGAYGKNLRRISSEIVHHAAVEAIGASLPMSQKMASLPKFKAPQIKLPKSPLTLLEGVMAVALLLIGMTLAWRTWFAAPPVTPEVAVAQAPPAAVAAPVPAAAPTTLAIANLSDVLQVTPPLTALMSELIRLWDKNITVPSDSNVCGFLRMQQLECYKNTGEWSDLSQIDRPAILSLSTGRGELKHVLLIALDEQRATLDSDNGPMTVSTEQLDTLWTGEYLLLWRNESGAPLRGMETQPNAVVWLRQQLAALEGITLPTPVPDRFDEGLREQLKRYQGLRGLNADGVVGARTLIALGDAQTGRPHLGATP